MMKKRYLVALSAVSAALAACGGEVGPNGGSGAGPSAGSGSTSGGSSSTGGSTGVVTGGSAGAGTTAGSGTTAGTSAGGTSAGGTDSGGSGGSGPRPTCSPGIPETTQIPRIKNRQYDAMVRDLLGVTGIASDQNKKPSQLLFADFDGPMNPDAWRLYQEVANKIADEVMSGANRGNFIACEPATAGCLTQTIQTFGRKAFRRPLTTEEVTRFEKLSQTMPAGTPEEVATTTLAAFLVSPSFLLLPEMTREAMEGTAVKLTAYEVATRLSVLLWDSVPDADLNTAADTGALATKDQILAQAQRMIQVREKTGPMVSAFHRVYLDMDTATSHWWKIEQDPALFPGYTPEAVQTFSAEMDRFFEDVAFNGGQFKDLFLSNIGYVNQTTAPLYGLQGITGPELQRVELDAAQRPGFLTRLGFLSSFSHPDSTSPILRGAFITVNMIGIDPGPPDPEAMQVAPPTGPFSTEREYVEALVATQPSCQGCHAPFINPPGFVLERYDAVGRWQDMDRRGGPIDATAEVTFADAAGNEVPKTITTPLELMQELGNGPLARKIYAERWVQFATGRNRNPQDACTVDQLDASLATDGYTVLNLLADLTQADSFRLRVAGL
jgi:hypothetical protein